MLRISKDRYRPIFCSNLFYFEHQNLFSEWNQLFVNLSSSEKVQAWTLALSLLRRSDDWFGGYRKQFFIYSNDVSFSHPLQLKQLNTNHSPLQIPRSLQDLNLFQIINQIRIKAIPETALRALTCLTNQKYPIEVVNRIPTPLELLHFQLNSRRVISFNQSFQTWPSTLYHGRDFLSFIIHDLIHADHFFASPENRAGQLGFYHCVQMILNTTELQALLQDNNFLEAFEYIISDMNSHPVHLLKTLQARLQHAIESEMKANTLWKNWTLIWSRGDLKIHSALQKINTQLFSDKDALSLTKWCIYLGETYN